MSASQPTYQAFLTAVEQLRREEFKSGRRDGLNDALCNLYTLRTYSAEPKYVEAVTAAIEAVRALWVSETEVHDGDEL